MTIPKDVRTTFDEPAPHENSNFRTRSDAPSPIGFVALHPFDAGVARPALVETTRDAHETPRDGGDE